MNRIARTALAAATIGALALPSSASADFTYGGDPDVCTTPSQELRDLTGPEYYVRLCGVADVDQFRSELQNNGGSYCVPTTLYDVLHYFGKRGAPIGTPSGALLAERDPQDPGDYAAVTSWLKLVSDASGGNPETGMASFPGARNAFTNYFTTYAKSKGWWFSTGQMLADPAKDFGLELAKKLAWGPVQLSYHRYTATTIGNTKAWNDSNGGHAVTVVAARGIAGTGEVELRLHDPARAGLGANTGSFGTQSPYTLETVKVRRVYYYTNDNGVPRQTMAWELTGDNHQSNGEFRLMVQYINWFTAINQD